LAEAPPVRAVDVVALAEPAREGSAPTAAPAGTAEAAAVLTDCHPGGLDRLTEALDGLFGEMGRAGQGLAAWLASPQLAPWLLAAAAGSLELARRSLGRRARRVSPDALGFEPAPQA
jgi:hypothetical protein